MTNVMSRVSHRVGSSLIDTHIHVLTPSYVKALEENGGDPSGWPTPAWTLAECIRFSDTINSRFSVLSVTAPGPALLGPTEAGRTMARALNDEVWAVCGQRPGRLGFFASLPDFNDIDGVLEEIEHVFGQLKVANGVVVMTSYGDKLLGDESFRPIWDALNKHNALVFVHPSHVNIFPEKISGFLPQPVIDYPQATTRAAMSLILSGIMTECHNVDVILSHAGGTLPYLGQRAAGSLVDAMISSRAKVNFIQAKHAMSRFYYDLALSTSPPQLHALLSFASHDHVLYGSDFPYAPKLGIYTGLLQYAHFVKGKEGASFRPAKLCANTTHLLRKHQQPNSVLPPAEEEPNKGKAEFGLDEDENAQKAVEELSRINSQ
ncbi:Amidohydrolase 2 [Pleurostoma richardsiae]|uniref:6-methylsalicylate decarboxylase n=1 Tax=Pleurostoma richardsiae TaxID=41990 RepID=A0AA38VQ51_9PEZI|nr:Amidohydrolase 2 [Pleurostoma richardsiae]